MQGSLMLGQLPHYRDMKLITCLGLDWLAPVISSHGRLAPWFLIVPKSLLIDAPHLLIGRSGAWGIYPASKADYPPIKAGLPACPHAIVPLLS